MGPAGAAAAGQGVVVGNVADTRVRARHCRWLLLGRWGMFPEAALRPHGAPLVAPQGGACHLLEGWSWGRSPMTLMRPTPGLGGGGAPQSASLPLLVLGPRSSGWAATFPHLTLRPEAQWGRALRPELTWWSRNCAPLSALLPSACGGSEVLASRVAAQQPQLVSQPPRAPRGQGPRAPAGAGASSRAWGWGRGRVPAPHPLSLQGPARMWAAAASWSPSGARTSCWIAACTWASATT